jgi:hypothetical protein
MVEGSGSTLGAQVQSARLWFFAQSVVLWRDRAAVAGEHAELQQYARDLGREGVGGTGHSGSLVSFRHPSSPSRCRRPRSAGGVRTGAGVL